ncbi:MAG TPA: hypothetical protein VM534_01475, partial [Thermoanaerobaculia bacterium]|nr:hypothetical protein [Thermoanaerobaculia bacterium]
MNLKQTLRRNLPLSTILAWRSFKARKLIDRYRTAGSFASVPADLSSIRLFRRESFPDSGPEPWLDRPDAPEQIERRLEQGEITSAQAQLCRQWVRDGYVILERFHDPDHLDRVWRAVEGAVESGRIPYSPDLMVEGGVYEGRILDLHLLVPELEEILLHQATLELIGLLLGRTIQPFQTIAFFAGSEQLAHSDFVH